MTGKRSASRRSGESRAVVLFFVENVHAIPKTAGFNRQAGKTRNERKPFL
jgi:hypothetical protein